MLERFLGTGPRVVERRPPRRGSGRTQVLCRWRGGSARLEVEFHRPQHVDPAAPLLFLIHGWQRDAQRYRDAWVPHAERLGRILVAPRFTRGHFPGSRAFNQGDVLDEAGVLRAPEAWALSRIEDLFGALSRWFEHPAPHYDLYGHSAGAQFVHRFVQLLPWARLRRAVAANAGWYTLPELDVPYPYGLRGLPGGAAGLRRALARELAVLLGDEDTDGDDPSLQSLPPEHAQGSSRFERGQTFFRHALAAAAREPTRVFRWCLAPARGIGHDHAAMIPAALSVLEPAALERPSAQRTWSQARLEPRLAPTRASL